MSAPENQWHRRIDATTRRLVQINSVSPSRDNENQCVDAIRRSLQRPFHNGAAPPLEIAEWEVEGDRKCLAALLRGEHPRNQGETLILLCHFDTVGLEAFETAFGDRNLGLDPDKLRQAMARLQGSEQDSALASAQKDLEEKWAPPDNPGRLEPAWMFGRGALDMKSGVAIHIEVLRELSQRRSSLAGNLLLVACPDEENESAGVLAATSQLVQLRKTEGLRYLGAINTDYTAPRDQRENARFIYTGTVGKILPCFYILGVHTHVGEAFRGVDAIEIATRLVDRLNLNPSFADAWTGEEGGRPEVALPPVALFCRDLKPHYNAETAGRALVYFNWLTHQVSVGDAIERLKESAREALREALRRRQNRHREFLGLRGEAVSPSVEGRVLDFRELFGQAASDASSQSLNDWLDSRCRQLSSKERKRLEKLGITKDPDSRIVSAMLVADLAAKAGLRGPAVVLFLAPPYYPHLVPKEDRLTRSVRTALSQLRREGEGASAAARGQQPEIEFRGFYPYISDLSYVGLDRSATADRPMIEENMPLLGRGYRLDLAEIEELGCRSVVNIGPWGRDAHGLYERVHIPYSFEVVPRLVAATIENLLAPDNRAVMRKDKQIE